MGFLTSYADYARSATDAPARFHKFSSLVAAGTLIGRRAWIEVGHRNIFPNLWVVLVAPSSRYRKSTCVNIARDVLGLLGKNDKNYGDPESKDTAETIVFPDDFTREGLIKVMSSQPRGCFFWPELLASLKAFERDYMAGTKEMLTHLYDCPPNYIRALSQEVVLRIKDPFVSVLAATTMEWFLRAVREDDFRAGFYPRFLFVSESGAKRRLLLMPPKRDQVKLNRAVADGGLLLMCKGQKDISAQAVAEYEDKHAWLTAGCENPILSAFSARMETTVLKLALIYQADLNPNSTEIEAPAMLKALAVGREALEDMIWLDEYQLTFSSSEKDVATVKAMLDSSNGSGLPYRDIYRRLHDLRRAENVLRLLERQEEIEIRMVKTTGRPERRVFRRFALAAEPVVPDVPEGGGGS